MRTEKLLLGNSYELIKNIPDKSIDLIVTDPPYDMETGARKTGSRLEQNARRVFDELIDSDIVKAVNNEILTEFLRVLKTPNLYIWCNGRQIPQYVDFFVLKHRCKMDVLIWQKTNPIPLYNNTYLTDKEYCLYFRQGGYCCPKTYRDAKTVFTEQTNKKDKELYKHPTIKPLNIIKTIIANSTREGDMVLDPFMGSGTTGVACKELGLDFTGIEISEKWYKVAKDRMNDATFENISKNQTTIYDFLN